MAKFIVFVARGAEDPAWISRKSAGRHTVLGNLKPLVWLVELVWTITVERLPPADRDVAEIDGGVLHRRQGRGKERVSHHNHRALVLLGEVESPPSRLKTLLNGTRCEDDAGKFTLAGMNRKEQVALLRPRWKPGRGPPALRVD